MTLKETIERLEKLDAQRTPGRVAVTGYSSHKNFHLDADGITIAKITRCERQVANRDFFAAAPDMITVIKELKARLDVAKRYIERHPYTVEGFESVANATDLTQVFYMHNLDIHPSPYGAEYAAKILAAEKEKQTPPDSIVM